MFGLVFCGFWSLATLLFDGIAGTMIYHQLRTVSFATEQGRVLESRVETVRDSDGTTYKPIVRYEFFVDDQRFENDSIRYMAGSSNDSFAGEFVKAHPVDAIVPVYYSEADPQDAVLIQGIQGSDLFLPLFLVPFNLIMLAGWYFGWVQLRPAPKAAGYPISIKGDVERLKLNYIPPVFLGAGVLGGLSFVSIFAVGFSAGFHAPLPLMLGVWSFVLSSALLAFAWSTWRNVTGRYDLVLDRFRSEVTLPITRERRETRSLKLREIQQAGTRKLKQKQAGAQASTKHDVHLVVTEQEGKETMKIAEFSSAKDAKQIAAWLNANWFGEETRS